MLPIGTVISIPERKKNIYKITSHRNGKEYILQRCLNTQGFPLAGDRTTYRYPADREGINVISLGIVSPETEERPGTMATIRLSDIKDIPWYPKCIVDTYGFIESRLSPENLSCDGELSRAEVSRRRRDLLDLKAALDKYLGKTVELCV